MNEGAPERVGGRVGAPPGGAPGCRGLLRGTPQPTPPALAKNAPGREPGDKYKCYNSERKREQIFLFTDGWKLLSEWFANEGVQGKFFKLCKSK